MTLFAQRLLAAIVAAVSVLLSLGFQLDNFWLMCAAWGVVLFLIGPNPKDVLAWVQARLKGGA